MIRTIEGLFEYQMREVIEKFKKTYELEDLTAEELQDKIWKDYPAEFGKMVLEKTIDYSGDELFEKEFEL